MITPAAQSNIWSLLSNCSGRCGSAKPHDHIHREGKGGRYWQYCRAAMFGSVCQRFSGKLLDLDKQK